MVARFARNKSVVATIRSVRRPAGAALAAVALAACAVTAASVAVAAPSDARLDWKHPGAREAAALQDALRQGELGLVREWLDDGLRVDSTFLVQGMKVSPLVLAVIARKLEEVKLLLDEGAETDSLAVLVEPVEDRRAGVGAVKGARFSNPGEQPPTRDSEGVYSPLMFAAAVGGSGIAAELLERGADVNQRGGGGVTALMLAAVHGDAAVARLLLDKGAEVGTALEDEPLVGRLRLARLGRDTARTSRVPDDFALPAGATALWLATLYGHTEVVELLVGAKADTTVEASCAGLPQVPPGEQLCSAPRLAELLGHRGAAAALGPGGAAGSRGGRVSASTPAERTELWRKLDDVLTRDDDDALQRYLDGGLRPNDELGTSGGYSLLTMAMQRQAVKSARLLVERGAEVDQLMPNGGRFPRSALMAAAERACERCVDLLLECRADVKVVGDEGIPAIAFAARSGKGTLLGKLVEAGADPNVRLRPKLPALPYVDGATPLWIAAAGGNVDGVRYLLGAGADPDVEADCRGKAWSAAATGCGPRAFAAAKGHQQVVALLDAAPSAVREEDSEDLLDPKFPRERLHQRLRSLVRPGGLPRLEALLERGLDPDTMVDVGGFVPLISLAGLADHGGAVATLLARGADREVQSRSHEPALATTTGFRTMAFPGGTPEGGDLIPVYSPLMYAATRVKPEPLELLLRAGADPDARGIADVTALMLAAELDRADNVRRLLAAEADVEARIDNRLRAPHLLPHRATALWLACRAGAVASVTLLLDAGADLDTEAECRTLKAGRGDEDCDCRRIAELENRQPVVRLIDSRGARVRR